MTIDLSTFPLSCIYGFIDESSKSAYIQFSRNNSLIGVLDNITALKRGVHDCRALQDAYNRGSLELRVIEEIQPGTEDIASRARCSFWFNDSGYTDIGCGYATVRYNVVKRIGRTFLGGHLPLVYMLVKSHSPHAIVVGVFETMFEANTWLDGVYPNHADTPVTQLHYCSNTLTVDYHKMHGLKMFHVKRS